MAYDVQKLLDIALDEVGYLEKETYEQLDEKTANSGDENYTKYQRDLAKLNYFNSSKNGVAWCAVFLAWCFVQAFGKTAALKLLCQPSSGNAGAGCTSASNYFKNKKQFVTESPEPGDVIFFYSSDKTEMSHTGLVYQVDKTYVYTVEGNTSSGLSIISNGGAVAKKKYKLNNDRIGGYGRPAYGDQTVEEEQVEADIIEVQGESVGYAWVNVKSGSTVNYRTRPDLKAPKVSGMPHIKQGEQVHVRTTDGTWAAVEYKDYRGYVMVEFLTFENPTDGDLKSENTNNTETEQKEQLTYTTVQGDTLWKIASIYLGSGLKYKKIMQANGMKNTIVRPGMVLKIPEE